MNPANGSTIIPCLRYRDARKAIDWLCHAFGFKPQAIHENDSGGIEHAQLTYGNGMVMLGEARDNAFGRHIAQPDEIGGRETQCACITVSDCRAHYEKAVAAGAIIVDDYAEMDYGGAGYSCHDPEGHLWYVGSYDPWQAE